MTTQTLNEGLLKALRARKGRSYWDRGVLAYAVEMVEAAQVDLRIDTALADLLNGARDWKQYAEGGCGLVYDADIAARLCSPSELRRKKGGELQPNGRETWLDVEVRALSQAWRLIRRQIAEGGAL